MSHINTVIPIEKVLNMLEKGLKRTNEEEKMVIEEVTSKEVEVNQEEFLSKIKFEVLETNRNTNERKRN